MSNRSVPNLEERLKHASEARKSMLAKFKMSLVEGPAAIEKRQRRQAIAAARAARAVQREEARLREEGDRAKQAELAAHAPGNKGGESETIIGKWLKGRAGIRDKVTIFTKVGSPFHAILKELGKDVQIRFA